MIGLFIANSIWLFLFGWETFWAASIVIVAYDLFLFLVLQRLAVNFASRKHSWQLKLSAAAFAANASWVTVASCLQLQVNALEEGWLASPDFAIGWLFGAVALASTVVYLRADPVDAAVAAWALGGIIANQADASDWGCNSRICPDCATGIGICDRVNTSPFPGRPNGFAALQCALYNSSSARECVVDKSDVLAKWCFAFIGIVAAALVAGVVRGLVLRAHEPRFSEMRHDTKEMVDDAEKGDGLPAPAL